MDFTGNALGEVIGKLYTAKYFPPERAPANSLLIVAALARPYLLFEVEAIAVLESP